MHYLRTTNPLNPENLAVYPRRIGTNRPNAYALPGDYTQLTSGLPEFDNRHCGNGVPAGHDVPRRRSAIVGDLVPPELLDRRHPVRVRRRPGNVPAPPCRQQGRFASAAR